MPDRVIPYGRQSLDETDIESVLRVLSSDYLTTGPEVEAFERDLAETCGVRHAVVVSSGTAALHCAYASADLGPGDEVLTTPLTFSATSNMVLACGAAPVFTDVEEATLCLDPQAVSAKVGPRTRALAPVDFAGHPAAMDRFMDLAERHGLVVIEDASHALGAKIGTRRVGSLAHLTTFSFHPVKTITSAEGGAVLTNDERLAERVRDFRNHGLVRDPVRLGSSAEPWYYEIRSLGFNYRLSDLHCALGRSQLRKLEAFVERRAEIVSQYRRAFSADPRLTLQTDRAPSTPAWHLFTIRVEGGEAARAAVFHGLAERGVRAQVHYLAVNAQPLYRSLGYDPDETPIARDASARLLSLPLYPAMTQGDVAFVVEAVTETLDEVLGR